MPNINIAYLCWTLALLLLIAFIRVRRARKRYTMEQVLQPKGAYRQASKPEFANGVWYCKNCYHIFGKPGLCDRHSVPIALTRGTYDELPEYEKMRRLIGSED